MANSSLTLLAVADWPGSHYGEDRRRVSASTVQEPNDEALVNLLALPFLCRAGSSLGSSSVLFTYAEI